MILVRVFCGYQVFGRGDEVIENVLFLVQHAGTVPVLAKFRTSPKIGNSKNSAVLQPDKPAPLEIRREAEVEPPIRGQQRRVLAVERHSLFVKHEHRDLGAVLRGVPKLLHLIGG